MPTLDPSSQMVVVPHLAQRAICAADVRQVPSCHLDETSLEIRQRICGVASGDDATGSQVVLSRQLLVEVYDL